MLTDGIDSNRGLFNPLTIGNPAVGEVTSIYTIYTIYRRDEVNYRNMQKMKVNVVSRYRKYDGIRFTIRRRRLQSVLRTIEY